MEKQRNLAIEHKRKMLASFSRMTTVSLLAFTKTLAQAVRFLVIPFCTVTSAKIETEGRNRPVSHLLDARLSPMTTEV